MTKQEARQYLLNKLHKLDKSEAKNFSISCQIKEIKSCLFCGELEGIRFYIWNDFFQDIWTCTNCDTTYKQGELSKHSADV